MLESAKPLQIDDAETSGSASIAKRKEELMKMSRMAFQEALKSLPENDRLAPKNILISRIMAKEGLVPTPTPKSAPESIDVADSGPAVNSKFENAETSTPPETKMHVVRESDEAAVSAGPTPEEMAKNFEENKAKLEAKLRAREEASRIDKSISDEELYELAPKPENLKRKNTVFGSSAILDGNRRIAYRSVKSYRPSEIPNYRMSKKEVAPSTPAQPEAVPPIIEQPKPSMPGIMVPKENIKPLPRTVADMLKDRQKNRPVNSAEQVANELEHAQDLPKGVLESEQGKQAQKIFGEKMGVTQTPEAILKKDTVKEPSQEARDGNIDGLVEFNLNKLGINKTELVREMPEFFTLKKNEQIYALQKLEQKVQRDLDRNSIAKLEENDKTNKKGGLIGKISRNMFKNSRLAALRKQMATETKKSGLAAYKDRLSDLTGVVERRGIDIEFGENGRLVLQFIAREGENPKHQKLIDDFNSKASKFADAPYDWSTEHAAPALKAQYKLIQSSFEKARQALIAYESKLATDENRPAKLAEIQNVDAEIEMGQFLSHNAGVAGAVNRFIKSNPYLEGKIGMAVGMGVRELGKNALAFGGGMLGSAVTGGFTSWIKKRVELRKLEEDQRAGINIGDAKGVKKAIDIAGYTERIQKLIKQVENAKTPESKTRALETLQTRITIAQDRIQNLGAINFGGGRDELINQEKFTRAIKKANVLFMENSPVSDEVAEAVYAKFDEKFLHDDDKSAERRAEVRKAFKRGAIIGASGFIVGYVAADAIAHDGEAVRGAFQKVEDISKKIYGNAMEVGDKMNSVFSSVGENVRDKLNVVSDENIIKAGKGVIAGVRGGIADVQNELNRAEFYANRGLAAPESSDVVRSINPVSERTPYIAEPDNTFVRTPANLPEMNMETGGQQVNSLEEIVRPGTASESMSLSDDLHDGASEIVTPVTATAVVEAPVGARGFIGAIQDLQRGLWDQYGGNMPANLREFAEGDANKIAIAMGGYRPGEEAESISLPRGSSIVATSEGIQLKVPNGYTEPKFFDSGAGGASTVPVENAPRVAGERMNIPGNQNQVPSIESQTTVSGEPEAKFDFEKHKAENLAEGWRHEAVEGGDIFSGELSPEAARQYAPELYPDQEPLTPESVEGYQNIDGLEVNTKELKGTVDFIYDSNGDIESVDLPKLQVEDVSRFRARPDAFIGGEHSPAERAALGKKLSTMGSQVETFLKYRRIMEIESLHPDTEQYQFLNEESQKLWSAIQKKVEYQFNPEYKDFKLNPIVNTAPSVTVPPEQGFIPTGSTPPVPAEPAPYVRNLGEGAIATPEDLEKEKVLEEAHRVETENSSAREIIKTTNDVIPSGNEMFSAETISKYGPVERSGNVAFFGKGYVGFYEESGKQSIAEAQATFSAKRNIHLIRGGEPIGNSYMNIEGFGRELVDVIRTRGPEGTYRILNIYKQVE